MQMNYVLTALEIGFGLRYTLVLLSLFKSSIISLGETFVEHQHI